MRSILLAALLGFTGAGEGVCDEQLTPIGVSRGWLVYMTPDRRILLESMTPGQMDTNVHAAVKEAFAQKARRDYIKRDSI